MAILTVKITWQYVMMFLLHNETLVECITVPLHDGPSRWPTMINHCVEGVVATNGIWRERWSRDGVGIGFSAAHQRIVGQ
ncbi:unnamed protein product, partial [Brenthis ino]